MPASSGNYRLRITGPPAAYRRTYRRISDTNYRLRFTGPPVVYHRTYRRISDTDFPEAGWSFNADGVSTNQGHLPRLRETRMQRDDDLVYVVDDDPDFCESIRVLLETMQLNCRTHSSAQEFLASYQSGTPSCALLDIRLPEMSGLELQEHLRLSEPMLPVILMSGFATVRIAVQAMKNGAIDFLEKPIHDQALLDAVYRALNEYANRRHMIESTRVATERAAALTIKEREVLQLVSEGSSSREIGEQLGVSYRTIEARRGKVMKKMQAATLPELIRLYVDLQSAEEFSRSIAKLESKPNRAQ